MSMLINKTSHRANVVTFGRILVLLGRGAIWIAPQSEATSAKRSKVTTLVLVCCLRLPLY